VLKSLFRKADAPNPLRELLFGDAPIDQWPSNHTDQSPFGDFVRARQLLQSGDTAAASRVWRDILAAPGLESRHYLQAWTFLRSHAQPPPASIVKQVLGVVVEVGMPNGLDLLAAYQDYSARYLNFSGAGVVWERPDSSLDSSIESVLRHAATIARHIGPWTEPRPGPPRPDHVRLNILTPSGLHFGEGPLKVISSDPVSAPLFQAATILMQNLIAKQGR
jgi:hypothetical protein